MHPLRTDTDLIVYLDVKSPYAYLAKDPTYGLIDTYGIVVDWRPLTLNIPSFLGSAKVDDAGTVVEEDRSPRQWQAVRYAYMDTKRYARLRDIKLYGPRKIWDTSLVHTVWLWVQRFGKNAETEYLDHVFKYFWLRELDVEDCDVLKSVLTDLGISIEGLDAFITGEGQEIHDVLQTELPQQGVFGVPTFVRDEEIFFGREHLPYIRWLLDGEKGQPPDIAYDFEASD